MVGIVVVSHSEKLAEGVVELAREMGGEDLALEAAGGTDEQGVLGTDAERVRAAIERAMSPDGVLVVMDLGSALMSAEFAVELLEGAAGRVALSEAPLVEGTVSAAVAARGGATLDEVAAEARGALAMKASQLGGGSGAEDGGGVQAADGGAPEAEAGGGAQAADGGAPEAADAEAAVAVRNELGLHARPAARLVATARRFDADVRIARAPDGEPVSARSLTSVVAVGVRRGDTLRVTATGPEAQAAVEAVQALAEEGFGDPVVDTRPASDLSAGTRGDGASGAARVRAAGEGDGRPGAAAEGAVDTSPPEAGAVLTGVPASRGIAAGPARHLHGPTGPPPDRAAEDPDQERERLEQAIAAARTAIEQDRDAVANRAGAAEADIFDAHLALLEDEAMTEPALTAIDGGATAERAWYDAAQRTAARYRALDDPLLRARATDVHDVGRRVVRALTGEPAAVETEGVVIAGELTPADAAGLDPERVQGLATAHGTATAHAAILARALGMPAVVGLGEALLAVRDGTELLLDGDAGTVEVNPPAEVLDEAQARRRRGEERRAAARARAHEPATTRDGQRVEVFANLGSAGEAARAVEFGAEGVGLLRTEFLFLDRAELPGEDEQAQTLTEIAEALDGRPLIVRTLDAGADKPLPALPMPAEANPFLGVRGLRLALRRPDVLDTQLRAILRVAAHYPLKAMLPMVSTVEELRVARARLQRAREETGIDAPLELGIMVEVPAAALTAAKLAEEAEFFSVGTNDLTQYTMAAERGDERLASLLTGPQPAVLRLIATAVKAASARGRQVGVCGELAGDPAAALLLVGLGVSELSMAPALVPEVKAALREVDSARLREVAEAALDAEDAAAARSLAASLL